MRNASWAWPTWLFIAGLATNAGADAEADKSGSLLLAGSGNAAAHAPVGNLASRTHDPQLDEVIQIPDFQVVTFPNGGEPVVFTVPAGLETQGVVVGFSFEGTASGVTGSGTWVSNTCMVIEAPDGSSFGVGGTGNVFPGCGNRDAQWAFHGSGSNTDGDYQSMHHDAFSDAFEILPQDAGDWTFTFVHDWNAGAGVPIVWDDVTVTLHKLPVTDPGAAVSPVGFGFEVTLGDTGSDTLFLSNTGADDMVWSIGMTTADAAGSRAHDPWLDETVHMPDFEVVTLPNGGSPVVFTLPAGVATRGGVVGFSFEGTASGVTGSGTWVSNTCMVIEAPDGTSFGVGGTGNVFEGCGNRDANWDFHGSVSNTDGDYTSGHPDAFDPPVGDLGDWTFTFVHDWNAVAGVPIVWDDVTVTLHKAPLAACAGEPAVAEWLDVDPVSGVTGEGLTDAVSVLVDSAALAVGVHEGWLCIATNDPRAPMIPVPVELTVFDESAGAIAGTVTGEGYCSADPGPLAGALVSVQGQENLVTTTTLADGSYLIEVDEAEAPLTITVTGTGHLETIATDVPVSAGSTITRDFSMAPDAACATVEPDGFQESMELGAAEDFILTIGNLDGGVPLGWDIHVAPADCNDPGIVEWLAAGPASGMAAPGAGSEVVVSAETAGLADGMFDALICVTTDDAQVGRIEVPFGLTVIDTELAVLSGTVTSRGACNSGASPLAGATVEAQGTVDLHQTATDENGFYQLDIAQSESPLAIVVSATDHADASQSDVVLEAGQVTTVDFELVGAGSDDVACIELNPENLAAAVPVNDTVDRILEIGNTGTQPLDWAIDSPRAAARSAQQNLLAEGVLLVPQHAAGFAVALDPETGDVLDSEFFAIDGLHIIYHILLHPDGERLLATSQNHNVVYSFDLDGQPLGVFAPAGGEDPDIMRNLRGMAIHPDTGQLLVTSGFWNSVEAFDQDGNYQGEFIPSNSGGIGGPWSIVFRDSDMLVSASGGNIYRYEHDGSFISLWNADISFPQQIIEIDNGNILAAAFGAPSGAWELAPNGHQIALHGPLTNLRGVYELPNGNILVTNSGGIHEIDRDGNLVETKLAGNSFMISHVQTRDCTMSDWLTISPAAGSVPAGSPADTVTVTFDPGELAPGTYQGGFCVTSNDPVRSTITVPVEMTVEQPVESAVIQGTVRGLGYCNNDIEPLAGAEVTMATAAGNVVRTTNAAGFYQASLPETASPVEVSVSAPDHQPATAGKLTFGGGDTIVQDFDLLLDTPCVTTDTDRVSVTLESDTATTATLELGNIEGNAALAWSMETAMQAVDARTHFPTVPSAPPAGSADGTEDGIVSLSGEPRAVSTAVGPRSDAVVPAYSTTGSSLGAGGYVFLDATQPEALTTIADPQPDRVYAATFMDNDFSREYMLASGGGTVQANTLGYIDIASGEFTSLGVIAGAGPGTWTSMKWDHRDATLYASSVNGAGNNVLYTIDPVTLQGTVVGPVVGPDVSPDALLIAIAISPQGLMYGIDIVDNVLLAIDKHTGEAAPIGPLGVNANLAQDMDFDQSTGMLYWAGFVSNNSRIFTINPETGWATPLGAVEGNAQLLSFSIAIAGAGFDCDNPTTVEWLAVSPAGGSVAPGALSELELVIDAAGLAPGEYDAGLCIRSNDPLYPLIKVPVELEVTVPARFTTIEGVVETLGRCGQEPAPLAAAEVTVESQALVYALTTGADGAYSIGIDPDEGPVTITVTAAGQFGDAITDIALPPFEILTHDFALVADSGCTSVDQTAISATVVAGTEQHHSLVLSNDGPRDGAFDITSDGHSRQATAGAGALFNVLIVSPDAEGGQHPIPPTNLVDDLNAFPGMNAALYTGPIAGLTLADVEDYDAVVTTNSASWRALNADVVVGDVLADFVDMGGKVIVHNFAYDHVGFRLAGRFIDESYGPITPSTDDAQAAASMVILSPDSPIFDNVSGVEHGELFRLTGSNLTPGAELLAEWSDGVPMIVINDSVMSINAMYSSNGEPADWTGDLDVIVYNGIRTLVGVPVVPVDWLSFNPAVGAVPVDGTHTVEVTFTALPDRPIGTYEATILLTVDDGAFTITIPVEMEIVDAPVTDGIFRDCFARESGRAGAACRLRRLTQIKKPNERR